MEKKGLIIKSRKMQLSLVLVVLACLAYWVFLCLHVDSKRSRAAMTHVVAYTHYELLQGDKVVLDFDHDTIQGSGCFVNRWALLPSCQGRVMVNISSDVWRNKYQHANLDTLLQTQSDRADSIYKDAKWRVSELNYYLRSHSVTDEGYATISQYAEKETLLRDSAKKMIDSLSHMKKGKKLRLVYKQVLVASYPIYQLTTDKKSKTSKLATKVKEKLVVKSEQIHRIKGNLFQLKSKNTPEECQALPMSQAKSLLNLSIKPWTEMPTLFLHPDSTSCYLGEVDSLGMPNGHGKWMDRKGVYYEGNWVHGKRDGFGFSISSTRPLRAGEWKNDAYRGERLVYTSDRIYGIDISKYQHVIGKKKYGIDWRRLRITHLGHISRKTVSGNVNFPISFIYVKSTEGATLLNPYYRQDYLAARAHGYKVGSYHFFSTLSPAAQQARQFLRHTIVQKGDFPPVLDVEPTRDQIVKMGGTGVLFARIRAWLRFVERETGMRPILYINQTFVNRYLDLAPDLKHGYHIWIARYGEFKPDIHLIYWQLCPDGRVAGIHGEVDINVFNGYKDAYDSFVKESAL